MVIILRYEIYLLRTYRYTKYYNIFYQIYNNGMSILYAISMHIGPACEYDGPG